MSDLSQLSAQNIRRQLYFFYHQGKLPPHNKSTNPFSAYLAYVDHGKAWWPIQLAS